ncbi:divergent PAP2 family protein [Cyanobium sp. Cruz CV13-4-11]|jgi:acid phosphatase family membrane protein YuiD|uniref:divergent PAP2 family protein n=1 Tax=unclassified Cyanobium TaxID=2627006 RepID=UPI0020CF6501|nr:MULTISPECIES: divergent PAP2 family protein [unclassified Cyanobium]MCP9899281.1 divergent PAP2 family protein [Cyanobium sp. Cruz CV11-17]MCP9917974.1 divergent PAP2 family protein [Cyanobium sp. Cruz CV13-4-11]
MSETVGALNALGELLANGVLAWGLAACGVAQLSKLVIELVLHRRWRPAVLIETGGMPSSHSALMTGTAAGLGWELGFADPLFALAAVLCFVVLYDASGVRRAAGLTAQRVNGLPDGLWDTHPQDSPPEGPPVLRPLKENLGHTRSEVLVGSLMGPLVALPGLALLGSPWQIALHAGWLPLG